MNKMKLEMRVERRCVFYVNGAEVPGRFIEEQQMAGMKLFRSEDGKVIVIDAPHDFEQIVSAILGEEDEPIEVSLIKASPSVLEAIRDAQGKSESMPIRVPVPAEETEDGGDGTDGRIAEEETAEPSDDSARTDTKTGGDGHAEQ